jgi:hypothetical protein
MLKISVVDSRTQRRLVLEGQLIAPWVAELRTAWTRIKTELNGRVLVIELDHITVISQEGENALLQLINDGAKFRCRGVLTKHVLQQLARRGKRNTNEIVDAAQPNIGEQKGTK